MFGTLIAEMASTIERLDPPAGPFETVELRFTFQGREGVLRFAASPSKAERRYVELSIYSEHSTSSQWLDNGTNRDLVAYLRRPEVIDEAIATAEECIVSLVRNRLA